MVELSRAIYSLKIYLRMIPEITKEHTIAVEASRIIDTYNFGQILTIVKRESTCSFRQEKLATNVLISYNMIKE